MTVPTSTSPFITHIAWWRRLRVKVLLAMIGVALFVSGALFATTLWLRQASLLEQFQLFVTTIAGTGAVAINGEDLKLIEVSFDAVTPEFQAAQRTLAVIRERTGLTEDELYILRPLGDPEGYMTEFVVMTHALPFIGNRYEIRVENREAYRRALAEKAVTHTAIYDDAHGTWISGYAPIFDEAGEVVAVLEADAEIGRYFEALWREILLEGGVTFGALLIALVPIWYFTRGLTRGITQLAGAIRHFENGQTAVELSLDSKDEIAAMAETFTRMSLSVSERLKLLPFVSRFTAAAVQKSAYVEDWLDGREREAAVLMTDVRGFTNSSSRFAARDLVRHLNDLLAVQSDLVIKHGGDVDKFMGDAVLAVFMGHPDNLERAVRCGKEIMEQVREQVRDWPEGWSLGGAVNAGVVVVGAVGSSARRDFTVVGHTVNTTAHLCAAARPWELLIQPEAFARLDPQLQHVFDDEIDVLVKHASAPRRVPSHRKTGLTGPPW